MRRRKNRPAPFMADGPMLARDTKEKRMTARQKVMAEAARLGCTVEFAPRLPMRDSEVLVNAPDGKSFDGQLTQLVCTDWADALERLAECVITDGEAGE